MLEICGKYGEEFSVDYNPTKTVCGFQQAEDGGKDQCEAKEVTMKKSNLIQRVNNLLVTLGQSTDTIISKVFTSKCAHFYGAQAWNFKDKAFEDF